MHLRENALPCVLQFIIATSVYNSYKAFSPRCQFTPLPSLIYDLSFISLSFALFQTFITCQLVHCCNLLTVFFSLVPYLPIYFIASSQSFSLKFNINHVTPHCIESNANSLAWNLGASIILGSINISYIITPSSFLSS